MAEVVHIRSTSAEAKVRHPVGVFALTFLTLGIYYFVWYYKVNREMRDLGRATNQEERLGRSPFHSLLAITLGWLVLVPPFVSVYRTFKRIGAAQEVAGTSERVNVSLGFIFYVLGLFFFPIEMIYAQSELNRVWRAERDQTAPAPA
ncbi:MAG TPA: DUF4234 domain-containing protein [Solirubrobacteraceae bacterium]